jgi:hypothetical protein
LKFSIYDTRPLAEKEHDLRALNAIQAVLEDSIPDYALENPENLYNQDQQEILRKLEFSKGAKSFCLVISPDGHWRLINQKFPRPLLMEIHNTLIAD